MKKEAKLPGAIFTLPIPNKVIKRYGKQSLKNYISKIVNKWVLYKFNKIIYQGHMKIASSLKSLKKRDLDSKLVRRRGRVYIINKKNPKFKARQK